MNIEQFAFSQICKQKLTVNVDMFSYTRLYLHFQSKAVITLFTIGLKQSTSNITKIKCQVQFVQILKKGNYLKKYLAQKVTHLRPKPNNTRVRAFDIKKQQQILLQSSYIIARCFFSFCSGLWYFIFKQRVVLQYRLKV